MYLGYEQEAVSNAVKDADDLAIPAAATHVELQASVAPIAYTMDDTTNPTVTAGMVLLVAEPPKLFHAEDVRRIKFIRFGGSDGALNLHYYN
jgi:hypothetical protein